MLLLFTRGESCENTVGLWHQIIIKMNTHFIKQDSHVKFENRAELISLRQAVVHGSEAGSYI